MLRCKPNELAAISRTNQWTRQFDGLHVTTIRLARVGDFGLSIRQIGIEQFGPIWIVAFSNSRPRFPAHDEKIPMCEGIWPDAWLRPIRDNDKVDETLILVGLPKDNSELERARENFERHLHG